MAKEVQEKLDAQVQIRMTKKEKAKLLKEARQMHLMKIARKSSDFNPWMDRALFYMYTSL